MIALLGGSGYIGEAFRRELECRAAPYHSLSRAELDYTRFDRLLAWLEKRRPEFVINCAGYTGKPNVDACESAKADTLAGNVILPLTIASACTAVDVPWGHVSSGCIYSGAKIVGPDGIRPEKDMTRPDLRLLVDKSPTSIRGFSETDLPNFSFRDEPCSFYSGSKALGEEAVSGVGRGYVWRLRIPFDAYDSPRNYLSKLQRYAKVYDNVNSISHRGEFAAACLELWRIRAPFGTYNVTNPGFVTARQVVGLIQKHLKPTKPFDFWADDEEFYRVAAKTPRSNCVMDTTKLLSTGVKMRPVLEALEHSLRNWRGETL
jgi:dTDP-4-dehydrorhamnose reductase